MGLVHLERWRDRVEEEGPCLCTGKTTSMDVELTAMRESVAVVDCILDYGDICWREPGWVLGRSMPADDSMRPKRRRRG